MFTTISKLSEIPLQPDTLYVLDFDETVVYYDGINRQWWEQRFKHHYDTHNDHDKADQLALKDWFEHIKFLQPNHIDYHGFKNIIKHCESSRNSHVMILTARDVRLENITREHMAILSPDHQLDIVFCCGKDKGEQLQLYLDRHEHEFEHIIFVDDQVNNLANFIETHVDAKCYHITRKRPYQTFQHVHEDGTGTETLGEEDPINWYAGKQCPRTECGKELIEDPLGTWCLSCHMMLEREANSVLGWRVYPTGLCNSKTYYINYKIDPPCDKCHHNFMYPDRNILICPCGHVINLDA